MSQDAMVRAGSNEQSATEDPDAALGLSSAMGASSVQTLWAENALTPDGWQQAVQIDVDARGVITRVEPGVPASENRYSVLLPSPANLHSHAFQRAMAGMTEARGPDPTDSFWTWRKLMYRFLDQLTPVHIEAITAFVQMEMLEAGYCAVGEFHYLHHQPDGKPYANLAEMSERVVAAAVTSGIGMTLLPVQYEHGGCDARALGEGQRRFGNTPDEFIQLHEGAAKALSLLPADANIGVAPHSLRAVSQSGLHSALELAGSNPFHIHVAEQTAEVDEIVAAWGARPVQWLLENHQVNSAWCLIHCTQMLPTETEALARSGAVVGLCPITESSLGDGIFDGAAYQQHGGAWGVGSDSNIRISLGEELRTLEYSQRLRDCGRAMFAQPDRSTGRVLFDSALAGARQAMQRNSGAIEVGCYADLLSLDTANSNLLAVTEDGWLDAWIFAADDSVITDVWSAGRHLVQSGQHIRREAIRAEYDKTLRAISAIL